VSVPTLSSVAVEIKHLFEDTPQHLSILSDPGGKHRTEVRSNSCSIERRLGSRRKA